MKSMAEQLPARYDAAGEDLDAYILRWLLHYSLQRIEDLAFGISATEQTVRRHVQTLMEAGLVERTAFSYSSATRHQWYHLTSAGIEAAATTESLSAAEGAHRWRNNERDLLHLFPRLPVLMHIQNLINHAMLEAPDTFSYGGNPAAIRWRWQRDYQIAFQDAKKRTLHCTANAAVVFRRQPCHEADRQHHQQEYFMLWIYADLGRAGGWNRQLMLAHLRQFLLYRESLERQPYRSQFPLMVVLVESDLQQERWHQAAYDAATGLRVGKPLAGVLLNLATTTLPPVWRSKQWQILGTRQPCSLQEMVQPMRRNALPPGILPHLPPIQTIPRSVKTGTSTQTPKIIRGQFQDRLEQLATQPHQPSKEREMVALLGLEMSQRYRDVLLLLYAHPLTSARELASLLDLSERTVLRYLWSLAQWHCTAMIRHEERSHVEHRWKLTPRGLRYIAASQRLPLSHVVQTDEHGETWQTGVSLLQKQWQHTAGVYSLLSAFHQAVRTQPNDQIRWFESHMNCARRYFHQGAWHNFRPDAVVLYEQGLGEHVQRWLLWLEWDGATMSREQLRDKMQSYAYYLRSREWRRFGHLTGLPILLFVTPSQGQANTLRALAEEILTDTHLQAFVTLRDLLEVRGVFAPIWYQAVPLQRPEQRNVLKKPGFTSD